MPAAYGWRAKVGKLNPTIIASTYDYEFYKVVPPGVMLLSRNLTVKDIREQADLDDAALQMEQAVGELKRAQIDIIVGGGTPVLLSQGAKGHGNILKMLADLSGVPAITSLSSAVDAFKRLGLQRIAVATALGKPELGEKIAVFLRENGLEVVGLSTVETGLSSIEKQNLDFGFVYQYGKKVFREADRPDAIYFPSATWPTVEYVEYLERDIGAPVISSALAEIWNSLKTLDIHEPIRGFGKLLGTL